MSNTFHVQSCQHQHLSRFSCLLPSFLFLGLSLTHCNLSLLLVKELSHCSLDGVFFAAPILDISLNSQEALIHTPPLWTTTWFALHTLPLSAPFKQRSSLDSMCSSGYQMLHTSFPWPITPPPFTPNWLRQVLQPGWFDQRLLCPLSVGLPSSLVTPASQPLSLSGQQSQNSHAPSFTLAFALVIFYFCLHTWFAKFLTLIHSD